MHLQSLSEDADTHRCARLLWLYKSVRVALAFGFHVEMAQLTLFLALGRPSQVVGGFDIVSQTEGGQVLSRVHRSFCALFANTQAGGSAVRLKPLLLVLPLHLVWANGESQLLSV